jgi:hypothetical protein
LRLRAPIITILRTDSAPETASYHAPFLLTLACGLLLAVSVQVSAHSADRAFEEQGTHFAPRRVNAIEAAAAAIDREGEGQRNRNAPDEP